jgi:hypothetical protein
MRHSAVYAVVIALSSICKQIVISSRSTPALKASGQPELRGAHSALVSTPATATPAVAGDPGLRQRGKNLFLGLTWGFCFTTGYSRACRGEPEKTAGSFDYAQDGAALWPEWISTTPSVFWQNH